MGNLIIVETTAFRRDVKKAKKRGKNLGKLTSVVKQLVDDETLEQRFRSHSLTGNWKPKWECHIEPDCL